MSLKRKSHTNNTTFQDIPKFEYVEHFKTIKRLSRMKEQYDDKLESFIEIRKKYVEYLKNNPFKKQRTILEKEVIELRQKLMDEIPNKLE